MSLLPTILERYQDIEFLKMDGFDLCIVGVADRINFGPVLVYSIEKIINQLMTDNNMEEEDALEYFEFNQRGAYVGENGPLFLDTITEYY